MLGRISAPQQKSNEHRNEAAFKLMLISMNGVRTRLEVTLRLIEVNTGVNLHV